MTPIDDAIPLQLPAPVRAKAAPARPPPGRIHGQDGDRVRGDPVRNGPVRNDPVRNDPVQNDPVHGESARPGERTGNPAAQGPGRAVLQFAPAAPGPFAPFIAQSLAQEVFLIGRLIDATDRRNLAARYQATLGLALSGDPRGRIVDVQA